MALEAHVPSIANVIQLAIAPVFMLTAIGAFLNVITARLADPLSSDSAKKGDTVGAVVTQPVFNAQHELLIGEGTRIEGTVLQTKASRSFGRNGQLRFVFRSVQRPQEEAQQVHGNLTGAEGSSAARCFSLG